MARGAPSRHEKLIERRLIKGIDVALPTRCCLSSSKEADLRGFRSTPPILLKNSISADDEMTRAVTGREARFERRRHEGRVNVAT